MTARRLMLLFLFAFGLALRTLNPLDRSFEYDQNYLAVEAQKILSARLTLIGPQTSAAQFFTGPLINYLAAGSYLVTGGHPLANTLIPVIIFTTGFWLLIYLFPSLSLTFLSLYALSPVLIVLDRTTWNPNLSFLAGALVWLALVSPVNRRTQLAAALGAFLSYQAHFSGLIMVLIALVLAVFYNRRLIPWLVAGLTASLLPLLVFDLRHDFLNLNGLIKFLSEPSGVLAGTRNNQFLSSFENLGKLLFFGTHQLLITVASWLLLLLWLPRFNLLPLLWLTSFGLIFTFFRGNVPDYYYLMALPAAAWMITKITDRIPRLKWLILAILAATTINAAMASTITNFSLKQKLGALNLIKSYTGNQEVQLKMDMLYQEQFGWEYLIDYVGLNINDQAKTEAHLIYPLTIITEQTVDMAGRFGPIAVWFREN